MAEHTHTTMDARREGAVVPIRTRRIAQDDDETLEQVRKGAFTSQQIDDPFAKFGGAVSGSALSDVKPPFNMAALLRMAIENSTLKQCIETMVTNVSGHGHRLEFIGDQDQVQNAEVLQEAKDIEEFLNHINGDYSILELKKRVRWDLEAVGNAFIEVARNRKGQITAAWHVPGHLMRLTETDKKPTVVTQTLPRFGTLEKTQVEKYFRRFVQIKGMKRVYFKEFGDPRQIDPTNGAENNSLSFEDTATEIIHMALYHAGSAYGLPRWINNVVAIQGSRQAELTNLDFFSENAVPAMVVLVAGGMISQGTMSALENHFTALRGRQAANRVVIVEAFGDQEAKSEDGTVPPPKLELKPLSSERPKEGMFLEYDKMQTDKVRSSFRLPPIFLGLSQDYTHATANTSYDVAEGQVFGPERVKEDDIVNRKLLGGYDVKYWEVRSNPPRITDPSEILDAVSKFDTVGAMTPNTAVGIANELFDLQMTRIKEPWGNLPMAVVDKLITSGALAPDEDGLLHFVDPDTIPTADQPAQDQTAPAEDKNKTIRRAMMDLRDQLINRKADTVAVGTVRERKRVPH
jgi:PBSX family phage portal protein